MTFSPESARARLLKARSMDRGLWWSFADAQLSPAMSREEATFWLDAMLRVSKATPPKTLTAGPQTVSFAAVEKALKGGRRDFGPEIGLVLSVLFPAVDLVELVLEARPKTTGYDGSGGFLRGVREHVVPRLSEAERANLRKRLAPDVTPAKFPSDYYDEPPGAFLLAAMLGMHDELLAIVASWADDRYRNPSWDHTAYHVPQMLALALGSGALVGEHVRRMKLPLRRAEYLQSWLDRTGNDGLDYAALIVVETKNKELAAMLAAIVAQVTTPENAGPMLEIATRSKAPAVGGAWFEANVDSAVRGLVAIASGRGALAEAAVSRLADLKRAGHGKVVEGAAKSAGGEKLAKIASREAKLAPLAVRPKWLSAALAKARGQKPIAWLDVALLPKLVIDGKALHDDDTTLLLSALAASPLDAPYALVTAIREHAEPSARDAFARKVFERWLGEGAPPKSKWALGVLGHLGGDAAALDLASRVRAWPGEGQHQRAVLGLDVLAVIGSDLALLQLSSIAQSVKFQALKRRADEAMDAIAKKRKMSRDELEDRIVPDGVGVDKKTLKQTLKIQSERLEQAMVKGRAWSAQDFDALLVRHPLMSQLVRAIVWGAFERGKLKKTFRIAEDGTAADVKDASFAIPKTATVRIMHPLELDAATTRAWGEVVSDYAIIAPFPQLGRPVHALAKDECKRDELTARFAGQTWGVAAFIGKLRRRGWIHGDPQDGGYVNDHTKPFFSANVTAIVEHTGYPIGGLEYADPQAIDHLYFIAGLDPEARWKKVKRLQLAKVDAKAISEVLYDLG